MLHWEEKWLSGWSQLSSSTSKAHWIDSFASAPPVVVRKIHICILCGSASGRNKFWTLLLSHPCLLSLWAFPRIRRFRLTSLSASSPTWFPPLNSGHPRKNLSLVFGESPLEKSPLWFWASLKPPWKQILISLLDYFLPDSRRVECIRDNFMSSGQQRG